MPALRRAPRCTSPTATVRRSLRRPPPSATTACPSARRSSATASSACSSTPRSRVGPASPSSTTSADAEQAHHRLPRRRRRARRQRRALSSSCATPAIRPRWRVCTPRPAPTRSCCSTSVPPGRARHPAGRRRARRPGAVRALHRRRRHPLPGRRGRRDRGRRRQGDRQLGRRRAARADRRDRRPLWLAGRRRRDRRPAASRQSRVGGGRAGGSRPTGRDALAWAAEAQARGAGEILLTSMDRDGTRAGFDCALTARRERALRIPVIASGGAGRRRTLL